MSRSSSRLLLWPLVATSWLGRLFRPKHTEPRRILIAHSLLLGDTLMLAALLARLRARHPDAEILMTCPPAFLPLFAAQPWGVKAFAYDPRDRRTLLAWWQRRGFDLAILPADVRLSWLALALGARSIRALAGDRPRWKYWPVDQQIAFPDTLTALPELFALLAEGGEAPRYQATDWPLAPATTPGLPDTPYVILHLGASNPLRNWPSELWQALAAALEAHGLTPVWSAGARETALVDAADPEKRWPSIAGQLDLLQLAHALRGARLLVCPDTGVMHLGRITGTPTLGLFGQGAVELFGSSAFFADTPFRALSVEISCRDQRTLFKREAGWVRRCARRPGTPPTGCARALCIEAIGVPEALSACKTLLSQ